VGLEEYLAIRSKLIRKLKRDDGLPWADASFSGFHHVQAVANMATVHNLYGDPVASPPAFSLFE